MFSKGETQKEVHENWLNIIKHDITCMKTYWNMEEMLHDFFIFKYMKVSDQLYEQVLHSLKRCRLWAIANVVMNHHSP
jgi:hypothetical protein